MDWPLLRGLPDEDVRRVVAAARRRVFARNQIMFHEGDPADTLHLITKGRVAVRITTPYGDTATLAVLGTGEIVGEMALLGGGAPRVATVVALEPTETLAIHQSEFTALREQHPSVTEVILTILAEKLRDVSRQLLEALYVPADARVLRRLLGMADLYRDGDGPVLVPLTQEDLAWLAGTTRATVNRVLRQEQKRGTLQLGRGKVTVLDAEAVARRAR